MHTLYSTECIVLGGVDSGEANKYISLFTKDIGLVKAVAKSVREEKSKLRYCLQDFSITLATLVRGKEVWRITGAEERYNLHNELKGDNEKLFTITQILNLLQRLVHGEEKNDYLFDTLSNGLEFIKREKINKDALKNFEHLIVLRILYSLGYIAKKDNFDKLLQKTFVSEELLKEAESRRKDIIFAINRALKEAHL
ncbi:MAG: DNA repair protein RecO [Candidatus Pacebacteria bacterium]|jgi:DNA repair protein RecO (recombination protein O)|nr:DNA repair protein RecO [Parcubacteria group bacterium]MDP6249575.1 DNA repair protein RecO [Candidatus Paceibacterota bacterium]MDP7159001.1 DNA repair protein RecO [Candidatus Paceibacterota bacterium]MDP7366563.1 DNA repair protein RecO [Candidatus Paceibacterota bacterium]MDP7466425.1 DNA repair protein RecO [Candidatus Paceibacterota bacterium]|tara:strand:+ start:841 stop:1431 length:591 start_codon:yes stop_codon:yes gene_type:complete